MRAPTSFQPSWPRDPKGSAIAGAGGEQASIFARFRIRRENAKSVAKTGLQQGGAGRRSCGDSANGTKRLRRDRPGSWVTSIAAQFVNWPVDGGTAAPPSVAGGVGRWLSAGSQRCLVGRRARLRPKITGMS